MSKVTIYVGLDYHKASIQVCVMDTTGKILANRPCTNQAEALVKLVAPFGHDVRAAIEACPGAANLTDELATRHGWSINLAHPGYVARMKQTPDKTDWADARVIADLVRVGYLPKVWLAPEDVRQLRALTRYRQQLANRRRDTKLRITALLRDTRVVEPKSRRWGRAWMDWFQTAEGLGSEGRWIADRLIEDLRDIADAILKVEHRLAQVTSEDPVVSQLILLAGVGMVTAWALRAEIGRFDRFTTGKQMARYCGLSPRNASSGQRQADAGLIKAGNEHLRTLIIEAAHRLIRYDPRWKALAASMRQAGKPACVVAAAVGNRWVRWLFHQVAGGPITLKQAA
ncbi:IS110 family transposase [Singulisphaera sp. Ch08]|uniref:IS110 family transposase n=1 Tax=Singulisphaera sp. Ch08 TaxID=3120278 RepID=A0AAU7CIJ9_9BACT